MRIKHLLYLLLALPLAFVACEKAPAEVEKPADKTPVLTLTSSATMNFNANGGEDVITYTLENPVEGTELTATCEADWVQAVAADKVRVTVEANEGDARETKIVVAYGEQKFEVAVKQAAKGAKEYLYDEEMAAAVRVSLAEYGFPDNYFLVAFYSADESILMGAVLVGEDGESILSAGTYTSANGGLLMEGFELYVDDTEEYFFEGGEGTIVVGGDIEGYTFDIDLTNAEGQNFHFTYEGLVAGMNLNGSLPTEDVTFEAVCCDGEYYGTQYTETYNYYLILSDLGLDENDFAQATGTYYQVDLYSVESYVDAEGYVHVPAGTYTFDLNDTCAEWTLGNYYSGYFKINADATAYDAKSGFDSGEAVVTENGITLNVVIGGVNHTVTYNQAPKIYVGSGSDDGGETPAPGDGGDVEFTAYHAYATYYGDQYSPGVSDNYYFFLSDLGIDADGFDQVNGTYYRFDIYAPITSDYTITPGTYVLDVDGTCECWTVGTYYSAYYKWNAYGDDYDAVDWPDGGFITFNEDGSIYAEVHMMSSGETHKVSFQGDIVIYDSTGSGGGGGGDYGDVLSTLTSSHTVTLDHHTLIYEAYGDYYNIGLQNWAFMIMPNDGEGEYVQFDILAGADSTDFAGTYTISDSFTSYTSTTGAIENGNLVGSWLYSSDYYTLAPFVDGTLYITNNNNGTYSVSFGVIDDAGNYIEGAWTGEALDYATMSTRGADLKSKSIVVNQKVAPVVSKERIEVKMVKKAAVASKGLKLR